MQKGNSLGLENIIKLLICKITLFHKMNKSYFLFTYDISRKHQEM